METLSHAASSQKKTSLLPVGLALVTLWKRGAGTATMWLNCSARSAICYGRELASTMCSSSGTTNLCYCLPQGSKRIETLSPSSMKKELLMIDSIGKDTVLIHCRRGSDLCQSVLIMQDADLKPGKVNQEQHKYWRCVFPVRSCFNWLPEKIAFTFCSTALEETV